MVDFKKMLTDHRYWQATKIVTVYTDGACINNPGPGGYAAILSCDGREKEITGGETNTTNNRMELMGAIAALEALKMPYRVILHTDSDYVVKGMNDWVPKWQRNGWKTGSKKPALNIDLWQRLIEAGRNHKVEFRWIKGHAGNDMNERADRLAYEAALRQV